MARRKSGLTPEQLEANISNYFNDPTIQDSLSLLKSYQEELQQPQEPSQEQDFLRSDFEANAAFGARLIGGGLQTVGDIVGLGGFIPFEPIRKKAGEVSEALKSTGEYVKSLQPDEYLNRELEFAKAIKSSNILESAKGALGYFKEHPTELLYQAGESLPAIFGAGVLGRGVAGGLGRLGVGEKTASLVGGALGEGLLSAGEIAPKSPELALATGAATAGFGLLGGKLAHKLGIEDIDIAATRGALETGKQVNLLKRIGGGAVTEGLEETAQTAVETALGNLAQARPLTEALGGATVAGGLAGGLLGGVGGALSRPSSLDEPVFTSVPSDLQHAHFTLSDVTADPIERIQAAKTIKDLTGRDDTWLQQQIDAINKEHQDFLKFTQTQQAQAQEIAAQTEAERLREDKLFDTIRNIANTYKIEDFKKELDQAKKTPEAFPHIAEEFLNKKKLTQNDYINGWYQALDYKARQQLGEIPIQKETFKVEQSLEEIPIQKETFKVEQPPEETFKITQPLEETLTKTLPDKKSLLTKLSILKGKLPEQDFLKLRAKVRKIKSSEGIVELTSDINKLLKQHEIKFSFAPQEVQDLFAVHSLSPANLLRTLHSEGTLPGISIGINRLPYNIASKFGDIYLIGTKEMVTPSKTTHVFAADAYTATHPETLTKTLEHLDEIIKSRFKEGFQIIGDVNKNNSLSIKHAFSNFSTDPISSIKQLQENPVVFAQYLLEKNLPKEEVEQLTIYVHKPKAQEYLNSKDYQKFIFNLVKMAQPAKYLIERDETGKIVQRMPYTFDNLFKLMQTHGIRGAQVSPEIPIGFLQGVYTPKFKSLEEIKAARKRIVSEEQATDIRRFLEDELFSVYEQFLSTVKDQDSPSTHNAFRLLLNDVRQGVKLEDALASDPIWKEKPIIKDKDLESLNNFLAATNFEPTIGEAIYNEIKEKGDSDKVILQKDINALKHNLVKFVNLLRAAPSDYFEAKAFRPVHVGEFVGAVIPKYPESSITSKSLNQIIPAVLEHLGVPSENIITYERSQPESLDTQVRELVSRLGVAFSSKNKISIKPYKNAETLRTAIDNHFKEGFTSALETKGIIKIISKAEVNKLIGYDSTRPPPQAFVLGNVTYLIPENIDSSTNLKGLLLHEIGNHLLKLGKTDSEFKTILKDFESLRETDEKVKAAFNRVPTSTPAGLIKEEALGYYLEQNPDLSLTKKVITWFRNVLRKLGLISYFTPDDIVYTATKALQSVASLKYDLLTRPLKLAIIDDKVSKQNLKNKSESDIDQLLQKYEVKFSLAPEEKDLYAVHSISIKNLLKVAQNEGTLVGISVGINRLRHEIASKFGEIYLIGTKELVTPSKTTRVFGADVYTPRHPYIQLETNILTNEMFTIIKKLFKDGVNLIRDTAKKYDFYYNKAQDYSSIIKLINEFYSTPEFSLNSLRKNDIVFAQYLQEKLSEKLPKNELLKLVAYFDEAISGFGNSPTHKRIKSYINSKNYQQFILDKIIQFKPQRYIVSGRTLMPYSTEYVLREMKKKNIRGGEFNVESVPNLGLLRALFTTEFKSLEDIQTARKKIIHTDRYNISTLNRIRAALRSVYYQFLKTVATRNTYDAYEKFKTIVGNIARGSTLEKELKNSKWKYAVILTDKDLESLDNFIQATNFSSENGKLYYDAITKKDSRIEDFILQKDIDEFNKKLNKFIRIVSKAPSDYFEAKLLRPVHISEFVGAVVPVYPEHSSIYNKIVLLVLKTFGIPSKNIVTYNINKRNDLDDKIRKLVSQLNVTFSKGKQTVVYAPIYTTSDILRAAIDSHFKEGFTSALETKGIIKIISKEEAVKLIGNDSIETGAQAFVYKDIAYLIYDNILLSTNLKGLLLHEVGNHLLKLGKTNNEFKNILKRFESLRETDKKVKAAFNRVPTNTPDNLISEEALGYYLEQNPSLPLAKRVIVWFRNILRKLGLVSYFTPDDIVYAATKALQSATSIKDSLPHLIAYSVAPSNIPNNKIQQTISKLPEEIQNSSLRIATTIKDVLKKGYYSILFGHDLIDVIDKYLPHAKPYFDLMSRKQATALHYMAQVDEILVDALKVKDRDLLNKFIKTSTRLQEWGFQPDWDSNAKVNPSMEKLFKVLSPEAQDIAKRVFSYGHFIRNEMRKIFEDLVQEELNQLDQNNLTLEDRELIRQEKLRQLRLFDVFFNRLKGPYAPLSRFGNYVTVAYSDEYYKAKEENDSITMRKLEVDPQHKVVIFSESLGRAQEIAEKLKKEGYTHTDYFEKELYDSRVDEAPWMAVQRLRTLIKQRYGDTEPAKIMNTLLKELILVTAAEHTARRHELHRRNIEGADDDMLKAFAVKGRADANFIASMKHNTQINEIISKMKEYVNDLEGEKKVNARRALNELLERHVLSMHYEPTPYQDKITAFTAFMFLLSNPRYYLTNLTQTYMMSVPYLAGRFGWLKSMEAVNKAYLDMAKGFGGMKGFVRGHYDIDTLNISEEEKYFLHKLKDKGKLDIGINMNIGLWEASSESASKFSQSLHFLSHYTRNLARQVELINRISTGLAAYRLIKQKGKNENTATEYAIEVIDKTHGDYSILAEPKIFSKIPAKKVITQFSKYKLIQWMLMAKLLKDFLQIHKLEPEQRKALITTTFWMTAHSAVMAGAQYTPLLYLVFWLAFGGEGDDGDPRELEQKVRDYIKDNKMADLILHGLPSLAGLELGKFVGWEGVVDPFTFIDLKGLKREDIAKSFLGLSGPFIGGVIPRFAEGVGFMLEGNYYRGIERMMPIGISNAMRAYREAVEGVTTNSGDVILDKEVLNAFDTISLGVLGIPTTKVERAKQNLYWHKRLEQHFNEQTQLLRKQYAHAIRNKDKEEVEKVRQAWLRMQQAQIRVGVKPSPLINLYSAYTDMLKREQKIRAIVAK